MIEKLWQALSDLEGMTFGEYDAISFTVDSDGVRIHITEEKFRELMHLGDRLWSTTHARNHLRFKYRSLTFVAIFPVDHNLMVEII